MPDPNLVHRILRALCANKPEEQAQATENYSTTNLNTLQFEGVAARCTELLKKCYTYQSGPPTTTTLATEAHREGDLELSLYADEIAAELPTWGANYTLLLSRYTEEKGGEDLRRILQESAQIIAEGRQLKNQAPQKGVNEAISHLLAETVKLQSTADPRHRTIANDEAAVFLREEYISRRDQPTLAYGMSTGITPIDQATKGGQTGELWIVGGFTSSGKTTSLLSWARYLAVEGSFNVLIYSLEMSKKQVWRILANGHSAHPKFNRTPLEYERIKSGTLTKEDDNFYLNEVLPDLTNPDYGRIEVDTPVGNTTLAEIRARAEAINRQYPLDMIIIDYIGLLGAEKGRRSQDRRQTINENIVAAKQMALEFDHGHGVLVASAHQLNRAGWNKAKENQGVYELDSLAEASEAERTSDVVLTIYQDAPLRQKKEGVITMLKNRDGAIVPPFNVYFPAEHRFIADLSLPNQRNLEDILEA